MAARGDVLQGAIDDLFADLERLEEQIHQNAEALQSATATQDDYHLGLVKLSQGFKELVARAKEIQTALGPGGIIPAAIAPETLTELETGLRSMLSGARDFGQETARLTDQLRALDREAQRIGARVPIFGPTAGGKAQYDALVANLAKQEALLRAQIEHYGNLEKHAGARRQAEDRLVEILETQESLARTIAARFGVAGGVERGIERFREKLGEIGDAFDEFTFTSLEAARGGLADFFFQIQEGAGRTKEALRDMLLSFLRTLQQVASQMLASQIFKMLLGASAGAASSFAGVETGSGEETGLLNVLGKGGYVGGKLLPIKSYAGGGPIFRKPHLAMIGEGRYDEAVVPLLDGRSIPVRQVGAGRAGGPVVINVNFVLPGVDAMTSSQFLAKNADGIASIVVDKMASSPLFRSLMV